MSFKKILQSIKYQIVFSILLISNAFGFNMNICIDAATPSLPGQYPKSFSKISTNNPVLVYPALNCNDLEIEASASNNSWIAECVANVILETGIDYGTACDDNISLTLNVFFDTWTDSIIDRIGSSHINEAWHNQWHKIERFENDIETQVWLDLQAQFADMTLNNVVYVTFVNQEDITNETVKLPEFDLSFSTGNHKAIWEITDACGNTDRCESSIEILDKKAPTPYLVHISTSFIPSNQSYVEVSAKSLDYASFDNCTSKDDLIFTFEELLPVDTAFSKFHFYKAASNGSIITNEDEYLSGKAFKWNPIEKSVYRVFRKNGVYNLNVNVWDETLNFDSWTLELMVLGGGDPYPFQISGQIKTTDGRYLNDVNVINEAILPEFPIKTLTSNKGNYRFGYLGGIDYTIHAESDDNPRNGVSTLDLVYIQRHILGLESFNDPLQIMASDATDDGKITASDLGEIRKLVLGIKTKMINNSWRFPIRYQEFDMRNPLSYIEKYELKNVMSDIYDIDFIAVKIGDINNTVVVDLQGNNTETRTSKIWNWSISDQAFKAGDIVSVPVFSTGDMDIYGCQLTMNTKGLRFIDAEPGLLQPDKSNTAIIDNENVTMSLALSNPQTVDRGTRLFTLHFIAEDKGTLHNALRITSDITPVEYYNSRLQTGKIGLSINHNEVQDKVVLYQNEPNPFSTSTVIPYFLPESGNVSITLYDMTGKKIQHFETTGSKGHNTFTIDKDQIGASVAVYYTFMYKDFLETKKMILVE